MFAHMISVSLKQERINGFIAYLGNMSGARPHLYMISH
jgi:hypothetical protein